MRVSLQELMDHLGVGYIPGPYETVPWSHYDTDTGLTASAEVRMGMDGNDAEGEIQFLYDTPPEGKHSMEHICYLRCVETKDGTWTPIELRIKGAPFGAEIYGWEEKSCDFFQAVVSDIMSGTIPDIDDLIEECFHKRERFGDKNGGSSKSPKIRPNQVLGMKKGRGF